ncbi:MAG TPA: hypothetical protein VGI52_08520 [Solirubrobacteraceae bacterium]|jgi:hypothetical protein
MSAIEPREIRWDTAQIEDAALTVELTGSNSRVWKGRFEQVLALLGSAHSSWGEARVTKDGINVKDVEQGSESELRHFLESVVLQANADPEANVAAGQARDRIDGKDDPGPDEQMMRTFRSFATGDPTSQA